jgi:hypothetical protein
MINLEKGKPRKNPGTGKLEKPGDKTEHPRF